MGYDIYDRESHNLVDSFATEREALAMVRRAVEEEGPESVETWSMGPSDRSDTAIAGQALIDRAMDTRSRVHGGLT